MGVSTSAFLEPAFVSRLVPNSEVLGDAEFGADPPGSGQAWQPLARIENDTMTWDIAVSAVAIIAGALVMLVSILRFRFCDSRLVPVGFIQNCFWNPVRVPPVAAVRPDSNHFSHPNRLPVGLHACQIFVALTVAVPSPAQLVPLVLELCVCDILLRPSGVFRRPSISDGSEG